MSIPIPDERHVENFDYCVQWLAQRLPGLEDDLENWSHLFLIQLSCVMEEEADAQSPPS